MFTFGILVALYALFAMGAFIIDKDLSAGAKLLGVITYGGVAVYAISSALLLR